MKRLFYLIASVAILFAAAASANAQEAGTAKKVDTRSIFFKGDFFVGIGGGVNVYHGEHDRQMSYHHRITPAMDVYLGKWIFPFLGFRVAYTGGHVNGLTNSDTGGVFSTGEIYRYYSILFLICHIFLQKFSRFFIPVCLIHCCSGFHGSGGAKCRIPA